MEGRYELYGVIPSQHADDNTDTPEQQKLAGTVKVYATDDKEEAMKFFRNGGFMRNAEGRLDDANGQWAVVTWAKDTASGRCIGDVPEGAQQNG